MAQEHAGEDRRRPSQQPHRRTPPLELQAPVKLKSRCLVHTAYIAVTEGNEDETEIHARQRACREDGPHRILTKEELL